MKGGHGETENETDCEGWVGGWLVGVVCSPLKNGVIRDCGGCRSGGERGQQERDERQHLRG